MAKHVVIDRDNMKFCVAAPDLRRASYHAWNKYPDVVTVILPIDEKRHFSTFSRLEILLLCKNSTGMQASIWEYSDALTKVWEFAQTLPVDETPLWELESEANQLPVIEAKNPPHFPIHVKAENSPETPQNGIVTDFSGGGQGIPPARPQMAPTARPSPKGSTGKVWEIADRVYAENGGGVIDKAMRAKIIAACEAEGINSGTAATQYGKWKATK